MLWFSSGGTKSVTHTDDYENILCVFAGTKELVMVDYQKHRLMINVRIKLYDLNIFNNNKLLILS